MRILPGTTRPDSDSGVWSTDKSNPKNVGWETDHFATEKNIEQKIINLANSKYTLDKVFQRYKIQFIESYSSTGWNLKSLCPFKDHIDSLPSFGYNTSKNLFNCFGCHRGGQAVEFISYFENRPKILIAKEIVNKLALDVNTHIELPLFDYKKLSKLLFDFADFLRNFKEKHNNSELAIKYAEAISWPLDVFCWLYLPSLNIEFVDLEALIIKLKEQVNYFED